MPRATFTRNWYDCIMHDFTENLAAHYMVETDNKENEMQEKTKETVKKIGEMPLKDLSELTIEELGKAKFFYQEIKDGWAGRTYWRVIAVYNDHRIYDDSFGDKPELSDVTRRLRDVYDIRTEARNNQREF